MKISRFQLHCYAFSLLFVCVFGADVPQSYAIYDTAIPNTRQKAGGLLPDSVSELRRLSLSEVNSNLETATVDEGTNHGINRRAVGVAFKITSGHTAVVQKPGQSSTMRIPHQDHQKNTLRLNNEEPQFSKTAANIIAIPNPMVVEEPDKCDTLGLSPDNSTNGVAATGSDRIRLQNGNSMLGEDREDTGLCLPDEKDLAVYSDQLGTFEDPMQFFNDSKTEQKKTGLRVEQKKGLFKTVALLYDSKEEVLSREQGMAGRFTYGHEQQWLIGGSYTLRRTLGIESAEGVKRDNIYATALDVQVPVFDSIDLLFEAASSRGFQSEKDRGYLLRGVYDFGGIRWFGGYIDLGENFEASYADPLHNVHCDAKGFETGVDYFMTRPVWAVNNLEATLRFFDLTRYSSAEQVQEMDGSLNFGVSDNSKFSFDFLGRREGKTGKQSLLGNFSHNWNDQWSSGVESKYFANESSNTLRITVDSSLTNNNDTTKLSFDWIKKETESTGVSLLEENRVRLKVDLDLWCLQLQGKVSEDDDSHGTSVYGRLEYKTTIPNQYHLVGYAAIGSQSTFDFDERIEIGMKIGF